MDGHLEKIRKHSGSPSIEDENQSVSEEVEEEAPVSSKISMKNEVVEVFEPKAAYPQKPLEMTKEHENSQSPQTFLNQRLSTLESVIERYEEEMKKSWEEQQTSSMKVLLNQMSSAKEEVKEQESEEDNQGSPYSMKATNKSTEERIVTKLQLIISRKWKRSTTSNPTPEPPASKLNQAIYKRKLAGKRPRKGALTSSSLPLRSFFLTNWKKRKKVISYMSVVFLS
ncbi:hypothetical protein AHAS_Ahas15G0209900 [Arachis hypogaea]